MVVVKCDANRKSVHFSVHRWSCVAQKSCAVIYVLTAECFYMPVRTHIANGPSLFYFFSTPEKAHSHALVVAAKRSGKVGQSGVLERNNDLHFWQINSFKMISDE